MLLQDGRSLYVNSALAKMTGYSLRVIRKWGITDFLARVLDEDRPMASQQYGEMAAGRVPPKSYVFRFRRKDGEIRWAEASGNVVEREGKLVVHLTIMDITDRKQTEEALLKSETRYQELFDRVPVGIYRSAPDGKPLEANLEMVRLSGFPDRDAYFKADIRDAYVDPDIRRRWQALIEKEGVVRDFEVQFRRPDGQIFWVQDTARAVRDADGKVLFYEGTLKDITERKAAERALEEARARVEFLNDLMAHDLNNINQGLMFLLELLLSNPALPEQLREQVATALEQVVRGVALIKRVKKFTHIDSLTQPLSKQDVVSILRTATRSVAQAFPYKDLRVESQLRRGRHWVAADSFLLDLFYNLLHNAMKYDSKDTVVIEVEIRSDEEEDFLRIEIKDQGRGIPDSEKARIFSRLPHQPDFRWTMGSGIGLTLVQRIIERYGGRIWVEDRVPGDYTQGANFIILLRKWRNTTT